MFEQIFQDLYRIEVPIPDSPLKAVNSYLIKGRERSLLIDTGMNRKECLEPLQSSLEDLDVDLSRTDIFITHLHADHMGLVESLKTPSSKVYFNAAEAALFNSIINRIETRQQKFMALLASHGFPPDELQEALRRHPGYRYNPKGKIDFTEIKDRDTLQVGNYALTWIETPGHSPGHMCLYAPDKKILFSGDHILAGITPNIISWPGFEEALKSYLASLEMVGRLEVDLVLPGHRSLMTDHRNRIRELQSHHTCRLEEAMAVIRDGDRTAWDVAPHISWDLKASSWEQFPAPQKWFAMGETLAHLNFLIGEGKIRQIENNGKITFTAQ